MQDAFLIIKYIIPFYESTSITTKNDCFNNKKVQIDFLFRFLCFLSSWSSDIRGVVNQENTPPPPFFHTTVQVRQKFYTKIMIYCQLLPALW